MKCSQCKRDARENRILCQHCSDLSAVRVKRHQSTPSYPNKKKRYAQNYATRLKSNGLCMQCGKENDRLPKTLCSSCIKRGKVTLNDRKIANPDKVRQSTKERCRRYYLLHTDEINNKSRLANSRRRSVEGSLTADDWEAILEKYNYTCLGCGRNNVKMTIDHVIPISKNGTNHPDNIQPLCDHCNKSKNTKILDFRPFGSAILEWT